MNTIIENAKNALEKLEEERKKIIKDLVEELKKVNILCVHCEKNIDFQNWKFIQNMYYVPPSGCTEGDYWSRSKTEVCHIQCPECNTKNYIYNHPQKNDLLEIIDTSIFSKEDIFASVEEEYK